LNQLSSDLLWRVFAVDAAVVAGEHLRVLLIGAVRDRSSEPQNRPDHQHQQNQPTETSHDSLPMHRVMASYLSDPYRSVQYVRAFNACLPAALTHEGINAHWPLLRDYLD
jgi:hypothetical protein